MYRHNGHFKVKWIVTNLIGVFRLWVFILIFMNAIIPVWENLGEL